MKTINTYYVTLHRNGELRGAVRVKAANRTEAQKIGLKKAKDFGDDEARVHARLEMEYTQTYSAKPKPKTVKLDWSEAIENADAPCQPPYRPRYQV